MIKQFDDAEEYLFAGYQAGLDYDYELALKYFIKYTELEPQKWYGFQAIGLAKETQSKYSEAISGYKKALDIILLKHGPQYNEVLEIKEGIAKNIYLQAKNFENTGRLSQAIEGYRQAIEYYKQIIPYRPSSEEMYYNVIAVLYSQIGDYDSALDNFKIAISRDDKNVCAHWNLGLLFNKLGQKEEALEQFNIIIGLSSSNYDAYFQRGRIYLQFGDYENAIQDFSKCTKLEAKQINQLDAWSSSLPN